MLLDRAYAEVILPILGLVHVQEGAELVILGILREPIGLYVHDVLLKQLVYRELLVLQKG
jgi:hypothetical protein